MTRQKAGYGFRRGAAATLGRFFANMHSAHLRSFERNGRIVTDKGGNGIVLSCGLH